MNSYVLCVRNKDKSKDEFGGDAGVAAFLQIANDEVLPRPSHAVGGMKAWFDAIVAQATEGNPGTDQPLDVVFFVHGYNTPPEESLKRQRIVERELRNRGFKSIVVGFDWPTGGSAVAYAYDRFQAQHAAATLVKAGIIPFTRYSAQGCPIKLHVMAHSMGGFVVREAFRAVDKGRDAELSNDWRIGQMVFFAADVSSESFELGNSDMLPVFDHCGRLTNYFSGFDAALGVSNVKNLDISARVGRVGMPTETPANSKALDVDCGPRYEAIPKREFKEINGMTSHSWYLEDSVWFDDLAHTLRGEIDRNSIPTRNQAGENDFVLKIQ